MRVYSAEEIKKEFARLNYRWAPPFQIIGIRSAKSVPDKFDDTLLAISGEKVIAYPCTTNPGKDYLLAPLNPKGAANMKPGQYPFAYEIGLHKGNPALIQTGAPITVYRDNNKNEKAEEAGATESGFFGINIHRANLGATSYIVGKWSAGCQVLPNPDDLEELLSLCRASGLSKFTYTLLNEF